MTYLLSDSLPGYQLRFDGNEKCDKCPLSLAPQSVVATVGTVAPLLAVAQQHRRRVHLKCSIDLADGMKTGKQLSTVWMLICVS